MILCWQVGENISTSTTISLQVSYSEQSSFVTAIIRLRHQNNHAALGILKFRCTAILLLLYLLPLFPSLISCLHNALSVFNPLYRISSLIPLLILPICFYYIVCIYAHFHRSFFPPTPNLNCCIWSDLQISKVLYPRCVFQLGHPHILSCCWHIDHQNLSYTVGNFFSGWTICEARCHQWLPFIFPNNWILSHFFLRKILQNRFFFSNIFRAIWEFIKNNY